MKFKIDNQTIRLIRKNLIYILTFLILLVSLIGLIIFFISKYKNNSKKISSLISENAVLDEKKRLIIYKDTVLKNEVDLDKVNVILTHLIPNEEDYFSIIAALDKLSQNTNFIINNYTVNLINNAPGQLSITVQGQGDLNTFIGFLQNYNFGGDRLITIDKVDFSTDLFSGTKIDLNFFNGKGSAGQELTNFTDSDRKLISNIMSKVQIDLKQEESTPSEYTIKANPF